MKRTPTRREVVDAEQRGGDGAVGVRARGETVELVAEVVRRPGQVRDLDGERDQQVGARRREPAGARRPRGELHGDARGDERGDEERRHEHARVGSPCGGHTGCRSRR